MSADQKGRKRILVDMPRFKTEAEEAAWWDAHHEQVEDLIVRGHRAGAVTRGVLLKALGGSTQTTIRLPNLDIERAKAAAGKKGLRYQTYLKMLIHEALDREEPSRAG